MNVIPPEQAERTNWLVALELSSPAATKKVLIVNDDAFRKQIAAFACNFEKS